MHKSECVKKEVTSVTRRNFHPSARNHPCLVGIVMGRASVARIGDTHTHTHKARNRTQTHTYAHQKNPYKDTFTRTHAHTHTHTHTHLFLALTARFVGRDALTAGGGDIASLSDSDDKGGAAGGDERSRSPYSMEGAEVHQTLNPQP